MGNCKDKCFLCEGFERFYTIGAARYEGEAWHILRTDHGWCGKKRSVVSAYGCCACFAYAPPRGLPSEFAAALFAKRKGRESEGHQA